MTEPSQYYLLTIQRGMSDNWSTCFEVVFCQSDILSTYPSVSRIPTVTDLLFQQIGGLQFIQLLLQLQRVTVAAWPMWSQ